MSVSASVTVSQSKVLNGPAHIQGRDRLVTSSDVNGPFSPSSSTLRGLGRRETVRSLPVRKARLSSSVHFVSTKRGGRTQSSASQTPARTPPEPNASERRGKSKVFF